MKKLNFPKAVMLVALQLFSFLPGFVTAQIPKINIDSIPVISGLTFPMQLTHAGDESNRIFIAERSGIIKVFRPDALASAGIYLDMNANDSIVGTAGEGGLLSIAFDPDFAANGRLYTYYTDRAGDLVLARYTATDASATSVNPNSRQQVLKIPHPVNQNHNGGELHFNKEDGLLYLSTGDGGGSNDIPGNAQNTESLLGKILRIDVNLTDSQSNTYTIPDGNPFNNEVYAYGLRNPFRWSFDRENGDMWIGDVGQGAREEINQLPNADALGANFGWRCYEGDIVSPTANTADCDTTAAYTMPVYAYETGGVRGRSVVGGVVYRGTKWPAMLGYYIGGDYFSGDIHKINSDGSVKEFQTSSITGITDFGEDEAGEIYAVANGNVYAISAEIVLPVRLASFSGRKSVEGVRLAWNTASEENFQSFDVEFSTDAKTFTKAGSMLGNNSVSGASYTFFHNIQSQQDLYYRLKAIDSDQSYDYSRIITVKSDEMQAGPFVLPSVIENGMLTLTADARFETMELVNTAGQVMVHRKLGASMGPMQIPLGNAAAGTYIVRLAAPDKVVHQKVLVVK